MPIRTSASGCKPAAQPTLERAGASRDAAVIDLAGDESDVLAQRRDPAVEREAAPVPAG